MENKKCWYCGEIIFNATSKYRAGDGGWRLKFRVECLECGLCGPYAEDENEAWEKWEEVFRKENIRKQTREFRLLTERCATPLPVCEELAENCFRIHCLACDGYGPVGISKEAAWEGWRALPEKGEKKC